MCPDKLGVDPGVVNQEEIILFYRGRSVCPCVFIELVNINTVNDTYS